MGKDRLVDIDIAFRGRRFESEMSRDFCAEARERIQIVLNEDGLVEIYKDAACLDEEVAHRAEGDNLARNTFVVLEAPHQHFHFTPQKVVATLKDEVELVLDEFGDRSESSGNNLIPFVFVSDQAHRFATRGEHFGPRNPEGVARLLDDLSNLKIAYATFSGEDIYAALPVWWEFLDRKLAEIAA